jgi:hypothetical protein
VTIKDILPRLLTGVPERDIEHRNRRAEEKQQQDANGDQQSGTK